MERNRNLVSTAETVTSENIHQALPVNNGVLYARHAAETFTVESNSMPVVEQSIPKNCAIPEKLSSVTSDHDIRIESLKEENEWECTIGQVWSVSTGSVSESNTVTAEVEDNLDAEDPCLSSSVSQTPLKLVQNTSVNYKPRIITATARDISLSLPQSAFLPPALILGQCPCCKEGAPPCPCKTSKQSTGTQYDDESSLSILKMLS